MNRSKTTDILTVCIAGIAVSALAGTTRVTLADSEAELTVDAAWTSQEDRTLVRDFTITLEDETEPGHLDIDIKRGDILVTAYGGDKILVRLSVPKEDPSTNARTPDGFQSVSGQPIDFEVRQDGNFIELDGNDYEQITHVEVFVPSRIDLTLDSYRTGVIRVVGVEGHIRARSQNNDIILAGVSGSADVYGYNGSFNASFQEVTGELEFETYNGDVDLKLPSDLRSTTFIRSERHDVLSQFNIVNRPIESIETEKEDGTRSIDFGKYVVGDINGGGSNLIIETTNGTVTLRKPTVQ